MRLGMHLFAAALSVVVWSAGASHAWAQEDAPDADQEARAAFDAGRAAFDEGHYEEAYASFAEAHRLSARPELLYNMGRAADRLRRDALAVEHYRAFLRVVPDTPRRLEVERRIATIEGAATAVPVPVASENSPPTAPPATREIWEEWWLWAIVGVVVVGGGVAIGVGVGTASPATESPIPGDVGPGGVVFALRGAF